MMEKLDLVVLVADTDAYWTIRTLIQKRCPSLGIRAGIRFEVVRHPQRDPGVYFHAHEFLRQYLGKAEHALVVLDREGSGQEQRTAAEIERAIENRLVRNGWSADQIAAIVLDPELEVWVWSQSPHVAQVIGLGSEELQNVLAGEPVASNGKPERPKETLEKALRKSGRPFSARIFQELAERVSLRANERAFANFKDTLQRWFSSSIQD